MSDSAASADWWRPQSRAALPAAASSESSPDMVNVLRLPFWALIAFTLIMILAPQNYFPALQPLHLALVTGALASGAYLLSRFAGTAGEIRHSSAITLAVLLFLWALALIPFSLWPGGSVSKIFGVFVKALIIFWLLGRVVNSVPRLRAVAWTLSLISIPLSLSAISAFSQGGMGNIDLTHGWERITGYRAGLTANPNDLALMINLMMPFTIGLMLSARRLPTRLLLGSMALLDVVAVGATYSRGGFLTLMTIIATYLWCLPGKARRRLLVAIICLGIVALPLIPSGYWSRLSTITDIHADQTDSAQERWTDMLKSVHIIAAHPVVGVGAGMDVLALNNARGDTWRHVHNIYLEYGVDLGLPGLLLFLLLYYQVFKNARLARRLSSDRPEHETLYRLSESILVVLIAFGVSAFFHPVAYEFYFYYIAGLAVAVGSIATTIRQRTRERPSEA